MVELNFPYFVLQDFPLYHIFSHVNFFLSYCFPSRFFVVVVCYTNDNVSEIQPINPTPAPPSSPDQKPRRGVPWMFDFIQ